MIQQKMRSTSRPCWISFPSRTSTSGRAGHTVTGTGRKQVAKNTTRQINFKGGGKKKYENIHDRFIRDKFFRKTMIEFGRSEKIILEMDRLASEDHSHIATQEEIDVYRGNWWIRSHVVNFDTMPTRRQPDFKIALSTLHRLKKAEDKSTVPPHGGNGKLPDGIPFVRLHHKDGLTTDRTGKLVYSVNYSFVA